MSKNRSNLDISNFWKSLFFTHEDEKDNEIGLVAAAFMNVINNEFQICFEEHENLRNILRGN